MEKADVLIFGYGNPSRGDDALGPLLVNALQDRLAPEICAVAGGIELVTDFQLQIEDTLELLDRRLILFADAHLTCPSPCGLSVIHAEPVASFTTHALSPSALLQVFRQVHGTEPPPSFLLSMRGEYFDLGAPLTPAAEASLLAGVALAIDLCAHPDPLEWLQRCEAAFPDLPNDVQP